MQAKPSCGDRIFLSLAPSKQELVDTSTWEQIIRVLEESSLQAFDDEQYHSGEHHTTKVSTHAGALTSDEMLPNCR
jgi:hypothetical protein